MRDRLGILQERHGRMQTILMMLFVGAITLEQAAEAFAIMEEELPYDDGTEDNQPNGPLV